MAKEITQEEKERRALEAEMLKKMQDQFNGCPLFVDREKGSLDDIVDKELTIEDIYPLQDYHCIVFSELPDNFYLTGGALKDLCNEYEHEFVIGRIIKIKEKVKTKKRRDFRPIEVIA